MHLISLRSRSSAGVPTPALGREVKPQLAAACTHVHSLEDGCRSSEQVHHARMISREVGRARSLVALVGAGPRVAASQRRKGGLLVRAAGVRPKLFCPLGNRVMLQAEHSRMAESLQAAFLMLAASHRGA
jgi:hypothetical protein